MWQSSCGNLGQLGQLGQLGAVFFGCNRPCWVPPLGTHDVTCAGVCAPVAPQPRRCHRSDMALRATMRSVRSLACTVKQLMRFWWNFGLDTRHTRDKHCHLCTHHTQYGAHPAPYAWHNVLATSAMHHLTASALGDTHTLTVWALLPGLPG